MAAGLPVDSAPSAAAEGIGRRMPARIWLGRLCLAAMVLLSAVDIAAAQAKRVLLLHSYGPYFAPWNAISSRMREEIRKQSPYPIDFYETSLQTERFGEPQNERLYLGHLRELFEGR